MTINLIAEKGSGHALVEDALLLIFLIVTALSLMLITGCAVIASQAERITSYIFMWETSDGSIHRSSSGPQKRKK